MKKKLLLKKKKEIFFGSFASTANEGSWGGRERSAPPPSSSSLTIAFSFFDSAVSPPNGCLSTAVTAPRSNWNLSRHSRESKRKNAFLGRLRSGGKDCRVRGNGDDVFSFLFGCRGRRFFGEKQKNENDKLPNLLSRAPKCSPGQTPPSSWGSRGRASQETFCRTLRQKRELGRKWTRNEERNEGLREKKEKEKESGMRPKPFLDWKFFFSFFVVFFLGALFRQKTSLFFFFWLRHERARHAYERDRETHKQRSNTQNTTSLCPHRPFQKKMKANKWIIFYRCFKFFIFFTRQKALLRSFYRSFYYSFSLSSLLEKRKQK